MNIAGIVYLGAQMVKYFLVFFLALENDLILQGKYEFMCYNFNR